jgi:hypothetical protein
MFGLFKKKANAADAKKQLASKASDTSIQMQFDLAGVSESEAVQSRVITPYALGSGASSKPITLLVSFSKINVINFDSRRGLIAGWLAPHPSTLAMKTKFYVVYESWILARFTRAQLTTECSARMLGDLMSHSQLRGN